MEGALDRSSCSERLIQLLCLGNGLFEEEIRQAIDLSSSAYIHEVMGWRELASC